MKDARKPRKWKLMISGRSGAIYLRSASCTRRTSRSSMSSLRSSRELSWDYLLGVLRMRKRWMISQMIQDLRMVGLRKVLRKFKKLLMRHLRTILSSRRSEFQ